MVYDDGVVIVLTMPKDGHCLFSSLLHQLQFRDLCLPSQQPDVMTFRANVADYIRHHLNDHRGSLVDTLNVYELPPEEQDVQIDRYLVRLRDTNEWGGEETLAAVSRMFDCRIVIYQEYGVAHAYGSSSSPGRELHIAYWFSRSHYDSVLAQPEHLPLAPIVPNRESRYCVPDASTLAWSRLNPVAAPAISSSVQGSLPSTPVPPPTQQNFKIGTWNVRGCSSREIQEALDHHFDRSGLHLVALQETRMASCTIDTPSYVWYNVNNDANTNARIGGGTAIMVHKTVHVPGHFHRVSSSTCSYDFKLSGTTLVFVSTNSLQIQSLQFSKAS